MTYKCGCGREFKHQQGLSQHGLGKNLNKGPCPEYINRKKQGLPLNVYNITINNVINQTSNDNNYVINQISNNVVDQTITDINELSDMLLEKMKMHFAPKRKPKNTIDYDYDYIYLVREARFIKSNIPIYKIGRTFRKADKRMAEYYPPGSELILIMKSHHSKRDETYLLQLFGKTFEIQRDMGNEYFMGDSDKMVKTIVNFLIK